MSEVAFGLACPLRGAGPNTGHFQQTPQLAQLTPLALPSGKSCPHRDRQRQSQHADALRLEQQVGLLGHLCGILKPGDLQG
jgi:hypothetical protein